MKQSGANTGSRGPTTGGPSSAGSNDAEPSSSKVAGLP
jgi:hypothetical protein